MDKQSFIDPNTIDRVNYYPMVECKSYKYIEDIKNAYPNAYGIKTEGGIYTGLGFGVEVNNFVGELNYNISRVGYTNENNKKYDYENAKVSATIGYKLDM
jgi:hypothetical protein